MTLKHAKNTLREKLNIRSDAHRAILDNILEALAETYKQAGVMEGKNCEPLREVSGAQWYEKV